MNVYRDPPRDDEEVIFKPRSRWPARIGIAIVWAFLAFIYYASFSAFGRQAVVVVPGPFLMTVLMTYRIWRTAQNMQ